MPTIKNLECLFSQGKITRREFIARASALGLTVALSPVLFSGKVLAAEPKKGGRLRIGTTGMATSDILDPALQANVGITTFAYGQLYDTLVEIDADSQPAPSLAKNWEPSPDAKTWTFNLRKGVEFHNGKSMTADDVFFSINHHRGKDSKSAAKSIVASIKNIKTDGEYRVIYTLDAGNADFPYVMSDYHLCIAPKGTKNFEKGIGTGPYMLDAFIAGV